MNYWTYFKLHTMKKIFISLFVLLMLTLVSISQQSCANNPEGAFTEEEKVTQDSSDSTSHANEFDILMQQDSISKDSNNK